MNTHTRKKEQILQKKLVINKKNTKFNVLDANYLKNQRGGINNITVTTKEIKFAGVKKV